MLSSAEFTNVGFLISTNMELAFSPSLQFSFSFAVQRWLSVDVAMNSVAENVQK